MTDLWIEDWPHIHTDIYISSLFRQFEYLFPSRKRKDSGLVVVNTNMTRQIRVRALNVSCSLTSQFKQQVAALKSGPSSPLSGGLSQLFDDD